MHSFQWGKPTHSCLSHVVIFSFEMIAKYKYIINRQIMQKPQLQDLSQLWYICQTLCQRWPSQNSGTNSALQNRIHWCFPFKGTLRTWSGSRGRTRCTEWCGGSSHTLSWPPTSLSTRGYLWWWRSSSGSMSISLDTAEQVLVKIQDIRKLCYQRPREDILLTMLNLACFLVASKALVYLAIPFFCC